jgi:hypothetical protein
LKTGTKRIAKAQSRSLPSGANATKPSPAASDPPRMETTTATRNTKPERRRQRPSKCQKRNRAGNVFFRDKENVAHVDFFKALDQSCNMAAEFLAVVAKFSRVRGALVASARGVDPTHGPRIPTKVMSDVPAGLLADLLSKLATEAELVARFSTEELAEMQKNLLSGLARHFEAYVRGYGDALRSSRLRERARDIYRMTKGGKILTDRHVKGESVPAYEEAEWTGNKTNHLVAGMLSLGNESSARLLLKPAAEAKRFYVDDIEPRGNKHKRR